MSVTKRATRDGGAVLSIVPPVSDLPASESTDFWSAQYAGVVDAEATMRSLLGQTFHTRGAEQSLRSALRYLGEVAEHVLHEKARAEREGASALEQLTRHDLLKLLTVRETAAETAISEAMVRKLIDAGELPHQYVGHDLHVPAWGIWQWQVRNTHYGKPVPPGRAQDS